jgi:prefoldin subunit 5
MEKSFEAQKASYKSKLPDMEQTLQHVKILKKKRDAGEDLFTNFSLSDTVYTKAKINLERNAVCIWIGANIMVEFGIDEAVEMLQEKLVQTQAKLDEISEDLFALRGNSITVEVNMARIINHSVKEKRIATGLPP